MQPQFNENQEHDCDTIPDVSVDRRTHRRVKTNKSAVIRIGDWNICACVIKDISKSGAKLLVLNSCWVPKQFVIYGLAGNVWVTADKVWQDDQQIGVKFS